MPSPGSVLDVRLGTDLGEYARDLRGGPWRSRGAARLCRSVNIGSASSSTVPMSPNGCATWRAGRADHPAIELAAVMVAPGRARETFLDKLFRLESRLFAAAAHTGPTPCSIRSRIVRRCRSKRRTSAEVTELRISTLWSAAERGTHRGACRDKPRTGSFPSRATVFVKLSRAGPRRRSPSNAWRRPATSPETLFTGSVATALLYRGT